jgi:hypothetical protein
MTFKVLLGLNDLLGPNDLRGDYQGHPEIDFLKSLQNIE